jgi:DNA-3-methyladenine glycosylase
VAELDEILGLRSLEAAPALLGYQLVVGRGRDRRSGRIVEVEAYEGADDPASHAANGPTPRNLVMFGPAGRLYVYRSYGIHWCANIVCGPDGEPGAVLVRAVEPGEGKAAMWLDRPKAKRETDLCSGPGKLCAALGITGDHDGTNLLSNRSPVRLVTTTARRSPATGRDRPGESVVSGPRVGITKAVERPWRFAIADNPHVSRPRP